MKKTLNILILEDNPSDAELIKRELRKTNKEFESRVVQDEKNFLKELETFQPDLILSDYAMPQFTGLDALEIVKKKCPEIPFIIVTGSINEETAMKCIRWGAWDYVLKDKLVHLGHAVKNAIKLKTENEKKKQAEEALRKSEEQLRLITENTNDNIAITSFDLKATYIYVNPSVKFVLGYEPEDLLGKSFFDFIHPEDKKVLFSLLKKYVILKMKKLLSGKEIPISETIEFRFKNKTGDWRFMQSTVNIAGKQLLAVTRDITEQKKSVQIQSILYNIANAVNTTKDLSELFGAIRELLGEIVNTTNFYIALYDKEKDSFSLPYHTDEKDKFDSFPAGKTLSAYVIRTGQPFFGTEEIRERLIQTGEIERGKVGKHAKIWIGVPLRLRKDIFGVIAVQSYTDASLYSEKDLEVLEFVSDEIAIAIDRKRTEEALQKSEQQYRGIFNSTTDSLLIFDMNGNIVEANPQACKMYGYTNKEITKLSAKNIIHLDCYHGFNQIKQIIETDTEFQTESVNIHKDGTLFDVEVSGTEFDYKGEPHLLAIIRDITERKQAEKKLRESEEKYRTLVENIKEGIASVDENENFTFVNQAVCKIFGYSKKEILKMNLKDLTTPQEFQRVSQQTSVRKTGKSSKYELQIITKDGSHSIISVTSSPLFDNNKKYLGAYGIFQDITERKQAEQERLFLSSITEQVTDSIIVTDLNYRITYVNLATEKLYGYSLKELIGKTPDILNAEPEVKKIQENIYNTVSSNKVWQGVHLNRKKDGSTFICEFKISPFKDEQGKISSYIAIQRDITERKRVEEKLKESEEQSRAVVEHSHDGIFIVGTDYRFIYVNDMMCEILGCTREEIIEHDFRDFLDEESKELVSERYSRRQRGEVVPPRYEFNIVRKDGEKRHVEISSTVIKDSKGKIKTIAQILDITEQKQAGKIQKASYNISSAVNTVDNLHELLIKIREYLENVIDTTNLYIALYDEKTDTISLPYNVDEKDDYETFPAGKTLTSLVIKTGKSIFAPRKLQDELNKQGKIDIIGTRSKIWLGVPLKVENKVMGVIAIQSYDDPNLYTEKDIEILTFVSEEIALAIQHKQAEDQIKRELKEKEVLLREVHHRVKNNLQVISGLLQLQKDEITTKEDALKGFAASQDRILAMAKAYELLLGSEYMSEVSAGKYIQSLADQLRYNYDLNRKVKLNYSLDELTISIEILDRLGLILNEIITNSIKYAFKGREAGNIHIELKGTETNLVIKISDDGIGIPEDIDINNPDTLGLSLIEMLTVQLGGILTLDRKNGTSFTLEIPKKIVE